MNRGAGGLRSRIIIERSIDLLNAHNEPEFAWSQLSTVWAKRDDVSDRERFSAGQVNAALTSRFRIRWSSIAKTVTAEDRIKYDGWVWEILGTKETFEGRKRFLEILAIRQSDVAEEIETVGETEFELFVPSGATSFVLAGGGGELYVTQE